MGGFKKLREFKTEGLKNQAEFDINLRDEKGKNEVMISVLSRPHHSDALNETKCRELVEVLEQTISVY